jgi:hypothetical protein
MATTVQESPPQERVSWIAFIIAAAAFIPCVGVPFALSAIAWGIAKWRAGGKILVALGAAAIVVTVLAYFLATPILTFATEQLLTIPEMDTALGTAQVEMAKYQMFEVVKAIEFFRLLNDRFPATLDELDEGAEGSRLPVNIVDPTKIEFHTSETEPAEYHYYYELDSFREHYYLLGTGVDGKPFTEDDILPDITPEEMEKLGYRVKLEPVE